MVKFVCSRPFGLGLVVVVGARGLGTRGDAQADGLLRYYGRDRPRIQWALFVG